MGSSQTQADASQFQSAIVNLAVDCRYRREWMLGVRRSGVSVAAGGLQRAGLIRYKHGEVTILDLAGLKKRSCECYRVTKLEFDRLLGMSPEHAEVETVA